MLFILFGQFVSILALKSRPQDLPPSRLWVWSVLGTYTVLGVLIASIYYAPIDDTARLAVLASIARTGLLLVQVGIALALADLSPRLFQTLLAMGGVGVLLDVLTLPLMVWFLMAQYVGLPIDFPILLALLNLIWQLIVAGHILRHAFETTYPLGFAMGLIFASITYSVLNGIFPDLSQVAAS
ncbi:MAG: hypothetical protein K0U93_10880 [Gammaproteobacteria bacterium]|nr:hypothetical protein [Gammaproteobacteria bacterium]